VSEQRGEPGAWDDNRGVGDRQRGERERQQQHGDDSARHAGAERAGPKPGRVHRRAAVESDDAERAEQRGQRAVWGGNDPVQHQQRQLGELPEQRGEPGARDDDRGAGDRQRGEREREQQRGNDSAGHAGAERAEPELERVQQRDVESDHAERAEQRGQRAVWGGNDPVQHQQRQLGELSEQRSELRSWDDDRGASGGQCGERERQQQHGDDSAGHAGAERAGPKPERVHRRAAVESDHAERAEQRGQRAVWGVCNPV